jgi:hypothetical protein
VIHEGDDGIDKVAKFLPFDAGFTLVLLALACAPLAKRDA